MKGTFRNGAVGNSLRMDFLTSSSHSSPAKGQVKPLTRCSHRTPDMYFFSDAIFIGLALETSWWNHAPRVTLSVGRHGSPRGSANCLSELKPAEYVRAVPAATDDVILFDRARAKAGSAVASGCSAISGRMFGLGRRPLPPAPPRTRH